MVKHIPAALEEEKLEWNTAHIPTLLSLHSADVILNFQSQQSGVVDSSTERDFERSEKPITATQTQPPP